MLIENADAHRGGVPGIPFAKRRFAHAHFHVQRRARGARHARNGLAAGTGIKAPARRRAAPVADILSEERHAVVHRELVARHGPRHARLVRDRHPGQTVLSGGNKAFSQQLRLVVREMLLRFEQLADRIVDRHRAVRQTVPALCAERGDEPVVLIKRDLLGVRKCPDITDVSRGIIADIHRRADLEHRRLVPLRGIERRGELRVAEGVHHAVVAHAVARAEVLVRRIIKHHPAEAAGDLAVGRGGILHARMAQRVLLPLFPRVEGLCREHVAVALGDKIRLIHIRRHDAALLCAGCRAVVRKVVIGVYVLQKMALFKIAHAGGLTGRIERMCQGIRLAVEIIVVQTFVDAHAPEDDGRMIPVLRHHLAHILHRPALPRRVADVLPAGKLGEHEQPQLVARIDKVPALRIVRRAHRRAAELFLQYPRVLALERLGRGVAHVGIALVTVQAAEEHALAVEIKTAAAEFRRAKAEANRLFVGHGAARVKQLGADRVEIRLVQRPRAGV